MSSFPHFSKNSEIRTPTEPRFTLSAIQRDHPLLWYLWPFPAREIFWSTLITLAVFVAGATTFAHFFMRPGPHYFELTVGIICGLWCGPYLALPVRLTIIANVDAGITLTDMDVTLRRLGYRVDSQIDAGQRRYYSKLRDYHRWLNWEAMNVIVHAQGRTIDVRGPRLGITNLSTRLKAQLSEEAK